MNNLKQRSIEIILENQAPSGAFVASPTFDTYNYCWFRDGAYIAYAADLMGKFDQTRKFHVWCADVIERYRDVAEAVILKLANGEPTTEHDFLPTRFSLDGVSVEDDWTNFQLDGYGTWLWGLSEYIKMSKDESLIDEIKPAIQLIAKYLIASWRTPCYDCWEEHLDFIHPYTIASLRIGIEAMKPFLPALKEKIDETTIEMDKFLTTEAIKDNQIIKMIPTKDHPTKKSLGVDASLIGIFEPYHLFDADSQITKTTIARIEKEILRENGGVYRYLEDTYYGGGEWLLLTCWLGWFYAKNGQKDKALQLKKFVESKADKNNQLPEQVFEHKLAPDYYEQWLDMWGENAKPLLWSHAMYIILDEVLK